MPIDPSIPLQAKRPEFMTPAQAISLQSLVQNMQGQRLEMQQRQKELQDGANIRTIFARPDALDERGQPTPTTLTMLAQVNPEYYRKSQAVALDQSLKLSQLASADALLKQRADQERERAEKLVQSVDEYAVSYVQPLVDAKADPGKVDEAYRSARKEEVERMRKAGTLTQEQYDSFMRTPSSFQQALGRVLTPKERVTAKHQEEELALQKKRSTMQEEELRLAKRREARQEAAQAGPPMTDEALDFAARQYLQGNQNAAMGYARSPAMKAKLMNRVAEIAQAQGLNPEQVNTKLAEFEGFRSGQRTLGSRGANLSIAGAELDQFVPIAQAASDKVPRAQFKAVNQLMRIGREQWSPEQAAFEAANRSVINAFAQLASRGVPTVHNTEEAEKMLNTAQTPEQYTAVLKQLQTEAQGALKAIQEAQGAMRGEHTQKPETPAFKALPKVPSEWEPGTLYQTPQGLLEWTGRYEGDKPVFKLPSVQSNEEARKLPKGTRFKGPDGNIYTR